VVRETRMPRNPMMTRPHRNEVSNASLRAPETCHPQPGISLTSTSDYAGADTIGVELHQRRYTWVTKE
jgi:hypothetical protein